MGLAEMIRPLSADADPVGDLPGPLARLAGQAAAASPHIGQLLGSDGDWLRGVANDDPGATMDALVVEAAALADGDTRAGLRRLKRRVSLLIALADLGGAWPLETVTARLSDFAEAAVVRALDAALAPEVARRRIPGLDRPDAAAAGLVVLGMGKLGARELNYSSDIDLIALFDQDRYDPDAYAEVRAGLVRAIRTATGLLSERGPEGYVFRTDLRLRPDPSVTPVCLPIEAAERYYESLGRTWERAAYIKARPIAGDLKAGQAFLDHLTPFVWRRHLDFAAVRDAHDMRLRIREHRGIGGPIQPQGHDLKLGRGGIREIEFFTQTRQIIAGGRDPSLRVRGTVEGLDRLATAGWIPREAAEELAAAYRAHRDLEHRVQMLDDRQTHDLPSQDAAFARVAALSDRTPEALAAEVTERLARVEALTEPFFDDSAESPATTPTSGTEPPPPGAEAIIARWHTYPALRSPRAVDLFAAVRPQLLSRLARASRPEEALRHLDAFVAGLPAGVQLFSLFRSNPQLLDLIVDVADTAPALARYLAGNAAVLDAVIAGDFFAPWPDRADLARGLDAALARAADYEGQLDAAKRWSKEWHFRVGVHHLRGLIDAAEAGRQYAELADVVLGGVWNAATAAFAERHGPMPGRGAAVVAMGTLGSGRLSATSDLDLILVYDPGDAGASEGPKPLPPRTYYARLTQAFVTALTAPTAAGWLYEVDLRLRPSGRQGPVATSLDAYRNYQRHEAWVWERLALTKARPVAGSAEIGADVVAVRAEVLASPGTAADVLQGVADMRARLAAAKPGRGGLEGKAGRGRLTDIGLLAEAGTLLAGSEARGLADQLAAGSEALALAPADAEALAATGRLLWSVQAAARLIGPEAADVAPGTGAAAFLCREAVADDLDALAEELAEAAASAAERIDAALAEGVA